MAAWKEDDVKPAVCLPFLLGVGGERVTFEGRTAVQLREDTLNLDNSGRFFVAHRLLKRCAMAHVDLELHSDYDPYSTLVKRPKWVGFHIPNGKDSHHFLGGIIFPFFQELTP